MSGNYTINKEFSWSAGHRVWAQTLDEEFSVIPKCKCRALHGHEYQMKVFLTDNKVNKQGMVVDFNELSWLKLFIDGWIDHKMIIDIKDPALRTIVPNFSDIELMPIYAGTKSGKYQTKKPVLYAVDETETLKRHKYNEHEMDVIGGFVFVDFIPTSENLAKWFYDFISEIMMFKNVKVSSILLNETPKSQANYYF